MKTGNRENETRKGDEKMIQTADDTYRHQEQIVRALAKVREIEADQFSFVSRDGSEHHRRPFSLEAIECHIHATDKPSRPYRITVWPRFVDVDIHGTVVRFSNSSNNEMWDAWADGIAGDRRAMDRALDLSAAR
jgi:hypothetical protein